MVSFSSGGIDCSILFLIFSVFICIDLLQFKVNSQGVSSLESKLNCDPGMRSQVSRTKSGGVEPSSEPAIPIVGNRKLDVGV